MANLKSSGLEPTALKQMENYLKGRFQRTKISNSYSSRSEIIAGVPQGFILGPALTNILVNYLLLHSEETFLTL